MIQNLTKLYEGEPLAGANGGVIYLPILFDCNLQGIDILTDEAVTGDCVFSISKNGVLVEDSTVTVEDATRIASSDALDVDLVKADEVVLNMLSGTLNSPITLNLVVDDGVEAGTAIADTDELAEGSTNLYFTLARVWATVLTGIVFTTNAAITAADSILIALGKLQAQITDRVVKNANITGATKTKITYDSKGLVTAGADVTATDIGLSDVTNHAQLKRAAADFASFTEKTVPVSADLLLIEDSAASGAKKKVQIGNLPPGGGASLPSQTGNNGKFLTTDATSASWAALPIEICVACSDETTAIAAGTAKVTFRIPKAITLTGVRASVTTAPTGSTIIIDINEAGTSILSTKLSIDAGEKTSVTAASAAVISDTALADDAEITIDFDQVGSTVAGAGVKVWLIGVRA